MAGLYRDRGVVLRSIKLGETDRIVTFLTEGRGKVRAVAKGVRKPKSRFGARLEPTTHLNLQLYEGRNLDVVTQVETIDSNRQLRETYGAFTQAIAMLEAVDHVAQEGEAERPAVPDAGRRPPDTGRGPGAGRQRRVLLEAAGPGGRVARPRRVRPL